MAAISAARWSEYFGQGACRAAEKRAAGAGMECQEQTLNVQGTAALHRLGNLLSH